MTIIRKTINEVFNFTRAGSATYWAADGTLKTAGPNEPRFHYDPVTGEALGLLVERQATNHVVQSENFTDSAWGKTLIQVFEESDPRWGTIARLYSNEGHHVARLAQSGVSNSFRGTPVTLNIIAKAHPDWGDLDAHFGNRQDGGPALARVVFFPKSGEIYGEARTEESGSTDLGGGWFHIWFSHANTEDLSPGFFIRTNNITEPLNFLYVARAWINQGTWPTSYIKTEATPVTRPADIIIRETGPEMNQDEGTWIIDISIKGTTANIFGEIDDNGVMVSGTHGNVFYTYEKLDGYENPVAMIARNDLEKYYVFDFDGISTIKPIQDSFADLRKLVYYQRAYDATEIEEKAFGDINIIYPEVSFRNLITDDDEILSDENGDELVFWVEEN